jgi:hypothetical protein
MQKIRRFVATCIHCQMQKYVNVDLQKYVDLCMQKIRRFVATCKNT